MPVYKFCEENNLTAVFHCGVGAVNLHSENEKNYSSCLPIGRIAKMFPNVNFVVSHFDYPNFDDCLKVITENKNVFTDISGQYENFNNAPYESLIKDFVSEIKPYLDKYNLEEIVTKVMFGTDYFGIGSGFEAVEEYIKTLYELFPKNFEKNFLYKNCLRAYPKISKYLNLYKERENIVNL